VRRDWYRCEDCKCYLDTRDNGICDECRKKREQREVQKIRHNPIKAEKDGQYRMNLACK